MHTNVFAQFVAVPMNVATTTDLKGNAKAILIAIMSHLPHSFPSIKTIQEETGLSRNTVFKWLKDLETKKLIKRHRRVGTSSVFEINPTLVVARVYKKMKAFIERSKAAWKAVVPDIGTTPVPKVGTVTKTSETIYKNEIKNLIKQTFRSIPSEHIR